MNTRGRMSLSGIATAAVILLGSSPAEAITFCVSNPACVTAGGTDAATLQAALNASAAAPGADRVEIGAGTFSDGPFQADAGNAVTVVGAGSNMTTLTRSSGSGQPIISLNDPASKVQDLRVTLNAVPGEFVYGLQAAGMVKRVVVDTAAPTNDKQIGVTLSPGAKIKFSQVLMPFTQFSTALQGGGNNLLQDSHFEAINGIGLFSNVSVVRSTVISQQYGISVQGVGNSIIDNALVVMRTSDTFPGRSVQLFGSGVGQRLVVRHATLVGPDDGTGVEVSLSGSSGATCPQSTLVMRDSIVRGFNTELRASASANGCTQPIKSKINVSWSNFDPLKVLTSGTGVVIQGDGNRNKDPLFKDVGAANFRLKAASPLVDRGSAEPIPTGQSRTDLDGKARVRDGNGDGIVRRDLGAYER